MNGDDGEARAAAPAPRWAVVGIFLLLLVAGLAFARAFLMPTVLAVLLALVFSPVRRTMERAGTGSGLAAFLITGALLALLCASVLALAAPLSEWIADAQVIGRRIEWKLRDVREIVGQVQEAARELGALGATTIEGAGGATVVVEGNGAFAANIAFSVPGVLAQAIFTLVLLFFLLASGDMVYEKIVNVAPRFRDKRRAIMIAHDIERRLSSYLFTITAINAGLGAATALAMWRLGVPNPAMIGAMAFLLNYIPYLGAAAGAAIVMMVGLVGLPTAWDAAVAAGAFVTLTSIEGQFVTPYFVGRNLRLNTVVVFLSVSFWAWCWSVVGMLVATPLLVAVRVFCEHIDALEPLGKFLSARGDERPPNGEERET